MTHAMSDCDSQAKGRNFLSFVVISLHFILVYSNNNSPNPSAHNPRSGLVEDLIVPAAHDPSIAAPLVPGPALLDSGSSFEADLVLVVPPGRSTAPVAAVVEAGGDCLACSSLG